MSRRFADDLLADFAAEAEERLDHLEELLLALPRTAAAERPALLSGVRLELHTLKGNAGMMGLSEQQVLAHELEDLADTVDGDEPDVQPLLAGVDRFRVLLAATASQLGAPTRSEAGRGDGRGVPGRRRRGVVLGPHPLRHLRRPGRSARRGGDRP